MNDDAIVGDGTPGLSQVERVLDVFVSPTATFRDILRSTSWWLPFLLMVLVTVGVTVAIQQKVGWEQVVETQIHMSPTLQEQMGSLTPPEQAQRIHIMVLSYQYSAFASPVIMLILTALGALVLWASFNFGLGASTTFGQIFCLWMYCSLPRLLSGLITAVMLCFGGSPESFNLKEPVGTSVGYYFPDATPWLRALLGYFDVVGVWVLVLLVIGGAIVAKVKVSQAAAVVVGWWLLIVLVSVAAAAKFS
jgi:Yip1 domain